MIGRLPLEQDIATQLARFPDEVRGTLRRILTQDDLGRARSIGSLWADERSRDLAELLIDIEVAPEIRLLVLEVLRGA